MVFWPKFVQKWILRSEFRKSNSGFGIGSFKTICVSISGKTDNFNFFDPNLPPKNLGLEIQKTHFRIKTNILEIPGVQIFWQNGEL